MKYLCCFCDNKSSMIVQDKKMIFRLYTCDEHVEKAELLFKLLNRLHKVIK